MLRTTALYALICAVTLGVAEIAIRAWDWQPRLRADAVGDSLGLSRYYHSRDGVGDLVANQNGHWVIWFRRPYHVQTNSLGLRNAEEPIQGAFRIVALGDSQTFGPYLANEDTWPSWLEGELRRARGRGDTVQVFNAGIAGYTIADQLAQVREKIVGFKPDLVILAVFENDILDLRKERNGVVMRPADATRSDAMTTLKLWARSSALFALAERVSLSMDLAGAGIEAGRGETGAQTAPAPADDFPRLAARYGELYREMNALLKLSSIPFVTVFLPAPDAARGTHRSPSEEAIRALAAEANVPYLDLTPVHAAEPDAMTAHYLFAWDGRRNGLDGNGHFSREGNRVTGQAVARFLEELRLVRR